VNGVLDQIVVDFECSVFEVEVELRPAIKRIGYGFPNAAFRQLPGPFFIEDRFYFLQNQCGMFLPVSCAIKLRMIPELCFGAVEFGDQPHDFPGV
jgi:hypothetical protein